MTAEAAEAMRTAMATVWVGCFSEKRMTIEMALGPAMSGIAMGTMMGKQLAELVVGEDVPMPREKLSPFAFHKFRNPGIAWQIITGGLMDKFM